MEGLPLGRIAALVPEFAVKDLPFGRTLMMMMMIIPSNEVGRSKLPAPLAKPIGPSQKRYLFCNLAGKCGELCTGD